MQIVKPRGHLIYSANRGASSHACLGKCQKVWRSDNVPLYLAIMENPACPQCGGLLTSDIPPGHYSVISDDVGTLKKKWRNDHKCWSQPRQLVSKERVRGL